jgi:hypothetical protein
MEYLTFTADAEVSSRTRLMEGKAETRSDERGADVTDKATTNSGRESSRMSAEKAGSPASLLCSKPVYRYALPGPGSAALATSGNPEGMVLAMQHEDTCADERAGRI